MTDWESEGDGWMEEGLDELQAVWTVLQRDKDRLQKLGGSRVFWETNSSKRYKLWRKGGRQQEVQKWAELVRRVEKEQRITLVFVWAGPEGDKNPVNRGVGQSTDEWSVQEESLQPILDRFGVQLTVAGFAAAYNTKCEKFFSKGPQERSIGVNFFCQHLSPEEVYLCCPPMHAPAHCIRRLFSFAGITAVLVVPYWTSAVYWPLLRTGSRFDRGIKDWYIWEPKCRDTNRGQSIFQHKEGMRMWAGLIRTDKSGKFSK